MTMLPEYQKLWKPYGKRITQGRALEWLKKQAQNHNIPADAAEAAFAETMLEIANGKVFPTDGCDCGCELDNPHTALVHYAKRKMLDLGEEAVKAYIMVLQDRSHAAILNHIHLQNEQYIKEYGPDNGEPPKKQKAAPKKKPKKKGSVVRSFVFYLTEFDLLNLVRNNK